MRPRSKSPQRQRSAGFSSPPTRGVHNDGHESVRITLRRPSNWRGIRQRHRNRLTLPYKPTSDIFLAHKNLIQHQVDNHARY